jgi:hypothetical protein
MQSVKLLFKLRIRSEKIDHPEPDPSGLGLIGRADAAPGGSNVPGGTQGLPFAPEIGLPKDGKNQMSALRNTDSGRLVLKHTCGLELGYLSKEDHGIKNYTLRNETLGMGMEDPARDQMKHCLLATDPEGVSRIVAPLEANHQVGSPGQSVHDLSFTLISPLRTEKNGVHSGHEGDFRL